MHKIIFSLIFTVLLSYSSIFVVQEGQRGIVLRFGKVLRENNNQAIIFFPGLHLKIPFIETVKNLDARTQTMDNQADRFVTKEKKDLIVDSYIKWCISDFSRYYLTTGGGDVFQAELLLKRKFSDRLRSEIGRLNVKDIVTDSRGRLTTDVRDSLNSGTADNIDEDLDKNLTIYNFFENNKNKITSKHNDFKNNKNKNDNFINSNSVAALGIHVVDVRIKQINLPVEVSDAIYNRMRAEREAVARSQRSQGQEEAEKLKAASDYRVVRTLAEAQREALMIKGEGDAESAKLFADAFSQDPEFYTFIRSLKAYKKSFNNKDSIIMNNKSYFLKYIQELDKNIK